MTDRWTDERLDRFADKVDRLTDQIQQLIQSLYLEIPNIKAEVHSIGEEAKEQRETLHAELVEIKEITRQQAITADRYALAAQTQAENIRQLILMLNQKQA
jgi:hypothetical protein